MWLDECQYIPLYSCVMLDTNKARLPMAPSRQDDHHSIQSPILFSKSAFRSVPLSAIYSTHPYTTLARKELEQEAGLEHIH